MRVCTKCGILKDESEFSWSIPGIKRHSRCKPCRAEDRMGYYETHKAQELEYKWGRQLRKKEEARAFVERYKETHPCVDWGNSDIDVLDV